MRAVLHDNTIRVYSEYSEKDIVKAVPGIRWDKEGRFWWTPTTPSYASRILALLRHPLQQDVALLVKLAAKGISREQGLAAAACTDDKGNPLTLNTKTSSWKHQVRAEVFGYHTDVGLLDMWMGTGKSKVVWDIIASNQFEQVLILCPKTVIPVWTKQEETHCAVPTSILEMNCGNQAGKLLRAKQFLLCYPPRIFIINYDSVWRGELGKFILAQNWDLVVFDESHRIKAPDGRASKFCAEIKAKKKLALTGTPMPHSPLDIFAQYRALDCGIFGCSFKQFRERYAILEEKETKVLCKKCRGIGLCSNCDGTGKVTKTYTTVTGYQHEDELRQLIDTIRFTAGPEVLDLPPLNVIDIPICLQKASRTAYDALQSEMVTEVAGNTITAENALVKLLRLQQITSGFVSIDTKTPEKTLSTPSLTELGVEKAEALADYLQDIGKDPIVVFCRFKHDIATVRQVAKDLNIGLCELSGDMNELKWWQNGATTFGRKVQVLAVQIQAGGVGIDLTRARYAIYFSLGLSLGDYQQTVARLHRPGQTRPVTVYRLLAVDTVDERIAKALDEKKEVVDAILREFRLKGNSR